MLRIFYLILFLFIYLGVGIAQTRPPVNPRPSVSGSSQIGVVTDTVKSADSWSLLSLGACGVDVFQKKHPAFDGRGTIICILDDGVDIGIEGLVKTSEGTAKVFDVQDFSGTGDVSYKQALRDGDNIVYDGQIVLRGVSELNIASIDSRYFYGVLPERRFQNGIDDLNFNGSDSDYFGVLIFEDRVGHFSAVVDGEGDHDISNEQILSTYRESRTTFRFRAGSNAKKNDGRYLTGAVNIYPQQQKINLYFADGGHGTHVAGIAAGCAIGSQDGFNGVAPGAEIVAIKFSDNTMGGVTTSGSMKRSYEYVLNLAKETGKPVIANMSFGIGSEIEGQSVMDKWLDSALHANPEVTICISASNDGPGLSNIGLPGSSRSVITSAAILPDDTGRDLYGVQMTKPVVWDFSSRGGELAKPDIATPGTAISTVPDYVGNDRYNGTSMASPYTAGFCSALISAMIQKFPDYKPNAYLVKRALQLSATPIEGMTFLDQGAGVPDLASSFGILSAWHRDNNAPKEYSVTVPVQGALTHGSAAFYRNGNFPKNGDRTVFTVTPKSNGSPKRDELTGFNAYTLVSDAPWLSPVQTTVYRRGMGSFDVNVRYDESKLLAPDIYTGKVLGYPKGKKNAYPEFEFWNTVIVPHRFSQENNFRAVIPKIDIKKERIHREFFAVPPACIAVKVQLRAISEGASADAIVVNADGRTFDRVSLNRNSLDGTATNVISYRQDIDGVIEIVVKSGLQDDDDLQSDVELIVEPVIAHVQKEWMTVNNDSLMTLSLHIVNGAKDLTFTPEFSIHGYERFIDTALVNTDEFTYPFHQFTTESSSLFTCMLEREGYNQYTDIGLQILKASDVSIANTAFDQRQCSARVLFGSNDTNSYRLYFKGGLANPAIKNKTQLTIREMRTLKARIPSVITPAGKLTLEPTESLDIRIRCKDICREPQSYTPIGELSLKIDGLDKEVIIPISL